jgi:hypothetical protein
VKIRLTSPLPAVPTPTGFPDANELAVHAGYARLHRAWRLNANTKDLD